MHTFLSRLTRRPAVVLQAAADPAAAPVHVLDSEARVRIEDGLLLIERPQHPPTLLRLPDVQSISLHGRAAITTPAVHALLREGVPLVWRSQSGHYVGQAVDLSGQTARVRRAQYAASPALALEIARRLIEAKILNLRAMLRRRSADDRGIADAASFLADAAPKARRAKTPDALRGIEGAASASTFACWPALLKGDAAQLEFPGRARRPPIGPVNALLSYNYAVLAGHCAAAALAAGLDPAEGVLHTQRAGRPSLALDLMEPLRPAVADSAALFALNTGEVGATDFAEADGATQLTDTGRPKALHALERRLGEGWADGRTWRDATFRMAHSLGQALVTGSAEALSIPVRT